MEGNLKQFANLIYIVFISIYTMYLVEIFSQSFVHNTLSESNFRAF